MRRNSFAVYAGFVGATVISLICWAVFIHLALAISGCGPVNFEASTNLNIGEHQGIRRQTQSEVVSGEGGSVLEDSTEEETPKSILPKSSLPSSQK